jgi:hypothetical protein
MPAGSFMLHQSQCSLETMPLPTEQLGYSGLITPCSGRACPDVFHAPPYTRVGDDIHGNVVRIMPPSPHDHEPFLRFRQCAQPFWQPLPNIALARCTCAFIRLERSECVQVAMAIYADPPHLKHIPSILPGTELPDRVLTAADRPRQETLWCMRHDERMRERRNGGVQFHASVVRPLLD